LTHPQTGADLNVDDFCRIYELSDDVLTRLKENGYKRTRTFKHITISQLHQMSFKLGDIASLQDAVDEWAMLGEAN
jgi:hypothetical protein